jgi:hypothetical protein
VVITAMKAGSAVAAVKLLLCLNLLCTFPLIVRGAFQVSVRDTERERERERERGRERGREREGEGGSTCCARSRSSCAAPSR